ncbi:MAG: hypothetical protein ACRDP1_17595, partial [Nocardioidaceae bacterium]
TQEYAVTQTPHTGSQGDSSMPPQVALCIGWRTGVRSRSAFGRTFLSGFDIVNIDLDGSPKLALLSAVRDAAAQLISDSTGGTYNLVVYSPKTAVSHAILSGEVKDRWATLRSRN